MDATDKSNCEMLSHLCQPNYLMTPCPFFYCLIVVCDESNTDNSNQPKLCGISMVLLILFGMIDFVLPLAYTL
jgi:hypothetical protein